MPDGTLYSGFEGTSYKKKDAATSSCVYFLLL